jgi:hypothetical protein
MNSFCRAIIHAFLSLLGIEEFEKILVANLNQRFKFTVPLVLQLALGCFTGNTMLQEFVLDLDKLVIGVYKGLSLST